MFTQSTPAFQKDRNFYEILGIPQDADRQAIKRRFYQLSLKYHPDRYHGSEEAQRRYLRITEAYNTLGDSHKRNEYDTRIMGTRPSNPHVRYQKPARTYSSDSFVRDAASRGHFSQGYRRANARHMFRHGAGRWYNDTEHYWAHYGQDDRPWARQRSSQTVRQPRPSEFPRMVKFASATLLATAVLASWAAISEYALSMLNV